MKHPLHPPGTFSTERLMLRRPESEDARAVYKAYASDPDIPRLMTWTAHTSIDDTVRFLDFCKNEWETGSSFSYVIQRRDEPHGLIGMITMHHLKPERVGFGYVIVREIWNKGYTSEALQHLVNWSLDQDSIHRAQAFCDVENPASARVMEKAGMSLEGTLKSYCVHPNLSTAPRDCLMYAKVR